MSVGCFLQLVDEMKIRGLLTDSRTLRVEEQLAIFLFTLAHNERNRVVQNRFQHSGEIISRYFNKCLKACLHLGKQYVKQAGRSIPQEISSNPLFYPWFKDCIGVIDGTHIPALIPVEEQPRYRNRKGVLSQNVLVVVDFDMNFQYVLAGRCYIVDAGYANTKGFLSPYRGVRYHLREWSQTQAPQNARELFNLRHSKLRNVVERTFAVLKKKIPYINDSSSIFHQKTRLDCVSCCILHNFIRKWNWDDSYFEEHVEEEIEDSHNLDDIDSDSDEEELGRGPTDVDKQYMCNLRDGIAQQIWNAREIR
ncbi:uncharacterized protein LOC132628348 [Lycium barbarum]|uniref:uncharacterized protein LOC132628348 n=1 Tax=Lycium barbarum TaxID=112863 RepID=UPI00293E1878|nr:uncharacterized protein LOC132628348 [Lycium barbarum]